MIGALRKMYEAENDDLLELVNKDSPLNLQIHSDKFEKGVNEHIDNTEWIDVDSYGPDKIDLSWFSADELLNNGGSYVGYYGYDYLGCAKCADFGLRNLWTPP